MADEDLQQYAIGGDDAAWDQALSQSGGKTLTHLSVKNSSGKKKHNHPPKKRSQEGAGGKPGGTPGGKKKKAKHQH